jgi:hypothetical protein
LIVLLRAINVEMITGGFDYAYLVVFWCWSTAKDGRNTDYCTPFLAAFTHRLGMVAPHFVFTARLTGSKRSVSTPRMPAAILAATRIACLKPETSLDDKQLA